MKEKRFLRVGEICAISLSDIWGFELAVYFDEVDYPMFDITPNFEDEDDVTLVKYLGEGMFVELLTNQMIMCEPFFDQNLVNSFDLESWKEALSIQNHWESIQNPQNMEEFSRDYKVFFNTPLCLDNLNCAFYVVDDDVIKNFASQSLDKTKYKLICARLKSQQRLQQQTKEYRTDLQEYFDSLNKTQTTRVLKKENQ